MNKIVYVVTGLELGWDCVCGVFENVSLEELQKCFPEGHYVISEKNIETNLNHWQQD